VDALPATLPALLASTGWAAAAPAAAQHLLAVACAAAARRDAAAAGLAAAAVRGLKHLLPAESAADSLAAACDDALLL
jgi:hypothetical protein